MLSSCRLPLDYIDTVAALHLHGSGSASVSQNYQFSQTIQSSILDRFYGFSAHDQPHIRLRRMARDTLRLLACLLLSAIVLLLITYSFTHTNMLFSLPVSRWSCISQLSFDFSSPFVLNLCIFSDQAKYAISSSTLHTESSLSLPLSSYSAWTNKALSLCSACLNHLKLLMLMKDRRMASDSWVILVPTVVWVLHFCPLFQCKLTCQCDRVMTGDCHCTNSRT